MNAPQDPPARHLIASAVAWHNRHLLARRITPAEVQGIGVVVLPFGAADATSAKARPRRLYTEKVIRGVSLRRLARWVLRHGQSDSPLAPDAPRRDVPVDPSRQVAAAAVVARYVATAAIEAGGRRTRVLLGSGPPGRPVAVLGSRLYSPVRRAVAVAAFGLGVAGALSAHVWAGRAVSGVDELPRIAAAEAVTPASGAAASPVDRAPDSAADPHLAASATMRRVPAVISPVHAGSDAHTDSAAQGAAAAPIAMEPMEPMNPLDPTNVVGVPRASGRQGASGAQAARSNSQSASPPTRPASGATNAAAAVRRAPVPADERAGATPSAGATRANTLAAASSPATAAIASAEDRVGPARAVQPIRPLLTESQKLAARNESARMRAALALAEFGKPLKSTTARGSSVPAATVVAKAAADPLPAGASTRSSALPAFALVTPSTARRADAEVALKQLEGLARQMQQTPETRVELMGKPQSWRAVWWPFAARADAERAQRRLQTRGIPVEVLEF